jgi:hypothetical protein
VIAIQPVGLTMLSWTRPKQPLLESTNGELLVSALPDAADLLELLLSVGCAVEARFNSQ